MNKCPHCDSPIVYSYNIERDSYYLRCKRDYKCWHQGCDKNTAVKYPKLKSYNEQLVERIQDSIDNGDDYYNNDDF